MRKYGKIRRKFIYLTISIYSIAAIDIAPYHIKKQSVFGVNTVIFHRQSYGRTAAFQAILALSFSMEALAASPTCVPSSGPADALGRSHDLPQDVSKIAESVGGFLSFALKQHRASEQTATRDLQELRQAYQGLSGAEFQRRATQAQAVLNEAIHSLENQLTGPNGSRLEKLLLRSSLLNARDRAAAGADSFHEVLKEAESASATSPDGRVHRLLLSAGLPQSEASR